MIKMHELSLSVRRVKMDSQSMTLGTHPSHTAVVRRSCNAAQNGGASE